MLQHGNRYFFTDMFGLDKVVLILLSVLVCGQVSGAGGVVGEAGSCMIEIGFYTAHFTIYQPENNVNEEFCEDLPDIGKTVFVMDYLHSTLKEVPVDFRIIIDTDGFGRFVRWENVQAMDDIEKRTVFFQPPVINSDDRMRVEHTFLEAGSYIGIVTAAHPTGDMIYHAVFPFEVGNTGFGYWPIILLIMLLLQIQLMFHRGMFAAIKARLGIAES